MTPEEIVKELNRIQERNTRVEIDKAWELSWSRRLFIAVVTYLTAGVWLLVIHDSLPWFKACVPAAGYILSTLTVPFVKKFWIARQKNK